MTLLHGLVKHFFFLIFVCFLKLCLVFFYRVFGSKVKGWLGSKYPAANSLNHRHLSRLLDLYEKKRLSKFLFDITPGYLWYNELCSATSRYILLSLKNIFSSDTYFATTFYVKDYSVDFASNNMLHIQLLLIICCTSNSSSPLDAVRTQTQGTRETRTEWHSIYWPGNWLLKSVWTINLLTTRIFSQGSIQSCVDVHADQIVFMREAWSNHLQEQSERHLA